MTSVSSPTACPDAVELGLLVEERLSVAESAAVVAHVEGCDRCQHTLAGLSGFSVVTNGETASQPEEFPEAVDDLPAPFLSRLLHTPPATGQPEDWRTLFPGNANGEPLRFAGYTLLDEIGRGGMGIVLRAHDESLDRPVALKILRPFLLDRSNYRERFLREARSLAAIDHPHIVPVYRCGLIDDIPFIAMKLLEGESLASRLKRSGPLSTDEVLRLGRQVANGLEAIHQANQVHRDIKPANIWLETPSDHVRLLDFGLAQSTSDESQLTGSGVVLGTVAYMSPEQARGEPVDAQTDLYALGLVLHEAATGGERKGTHGRGNDNGFASSSLAPPENWPEPARSTLRSLLHFDPGERPATAGVLIDRFRPARTNRLRRRLLASCGLVLLALLTVVLRMKTPHGDVVVELAEGIDPKSVSIEARSDGMLSVLDADRGWSIELNEGVYRIRLRQGKDSLQIDRDTVRVSRDQTERVRVSLKRAERDRTTTPKPSQPLPPVPIANDAEVARWALSVGAELTLHRGERNVTVSKASELPEEPFQLWGINFWHSTAGDEDLKRLDGLQHLHQIQIGHERTGNGFTDEASLILGSLRLPEIRYIYVRRIRVAERHLRALSSLRPVLLRLFKTETTDADLVGLADNASIRLLALTHQPISGHGLTHLKALPLHYLMFSHITRLKPEELSGFPTWSTLRTMRIQGRTTTARTGLKPFLVSRSLEELVVEDATSATPADWHAVATLPELRRLEIANSVGLTPEVLNGFTNIPKLEELVLPAEQIDEEQRTTLRKAIPVVRFVATPRNPR